MTEDEFSILTRDLDHEMKQSDREHELERREVISRFAREGLGRAITIRKDSGKKVYTGDMREQPDVEFFIPENSAYDPDAYALPLEGQYEHVVLFPGSRRMLLVRRRDTKDSSYEDVFATGNTPHEFVPGAVDGEDGLIQFFGYVDDASHPGWIVKDSEQKGQKFHFKVLVASAFHNAVAARTKQGHIVENVPGLFFDLSKAFLSTTISPKKEGPGTPSSRPPDVQ